GIEPLAAVRPGEAPVFVKELEEEQAADPLVAIGERVVLDDEIKQRRGPLLDAWIERLATEGLLDVAEYAGEAIAGLATEQVAGFAFLHQLGLQGSNRGVRLLDRQPLDPPGRGQGAFRQPV